MEYSYKLNDHNFWKEQSNATFKIQEFAIDIYYPEFNVIIYDGERILRSHFNKY